MIRNSNEELVADEKIQDASSFSRFPHSIKIAQQTPWSFETQLFLLLPVEKRHVGKYSVQAFLEYEGWSVVSNNLFFTVKLPA